MRRNSANEALSVGRLAGDLRRGFGGSYICPGPKSLLRVLSPFFDYEPELVVTRQVRMLTCRLAVSPQLSVPPSMAF